MADATEAPRIIPPTVGRVVWFNAMKTGAFPGSDGTRAAVVAHVHSDRMVNLCVIDANGATRSETSVPLVQPGDPVPETAHATWMPYQIGQEGAKRGRGRPGETGIEHRSLPAGD